MGSMHALYATEGYYSLNPSLVALPLRLPLASHSVIEHLKLNYQHLPHFMRETRVQLSVPRAAQVWPLV